MKRILFSIFTMMVALISALTAKAANDFSFTIKWDNPGAISVVLKDVTGTPEALDPSATSITVKQAGYVYLRPAKGYIIKSVTDGDGKSYNLSGYKNYGGQYVSLNCYSANGYVFNVETEKLQKTGEFELNVINGDFALEAYLINGDMKGLSTYTSPVLSKGTNKVELTAYDNELVLAREDGKAIYSVKKNGEDFNLGDSGEIPVKNGDKIDVRVYETEPARAAVTIKYTYGSEGCLNNVFNRETSKMIPASDIKAAGGVLNCNVGATLRFNFNEDFNIKSIKVNSADADVPAEGDPFLATVNEDTEIILDAAAKVYSDIEGVVYVAGPVEGLKFTTGIMEYDLEIPLSGGTTLTSDVVFTYSNGNNFTIKAGTAKKYTLKMPGKTRKFFYDALPGYWIVDRILGNPEDPDYITANFAVGADEAPLYVKVARVENNTKAVVFYEGEDNAAAFTAQNVRFSGKMEVDGIGGKYLSNGYSVISFDKDYHESFSVGKAGGINSNELVAYQDGKKLKYNEDSMSYSDIKLEEGSVLKVFSVPSGKTPDAHSVKFELDPGMAAEVTYDLVKSHNPQSELECVGTTMVSVKPASASKVLLDGKELAANAEGRFEFTTSKKGHVVTLSGTTGVSEIESAGNAGGKIFNLQGISIEGSMESLPSGIYIVNGKKVIKK